MRALMTLATKDLRLLARDRIALFWSVAFPLMFALFFGALFGGDPGSKSKLTVVVVDQANSDASAGLIQRLEQSESLQVDRASSLSAAEALVRKGERVAYLRVKDGFSDGPFALFGGSQDAESTIEIGVDPARSAERGMLVGVVNQSLFSGLGSQFTDPARMAEQVAAAKASLSSSTTLDPSQLATMNNFFDALGEFSREADSSGLQSPPSMGGGLVQTTEVGRDSSGKPRSSFQVTFPSAMIWGLMGVATTFAASLVRERTAGTLLRLQVAPLHRGQLLAGKGLACFIAGLAVSTFLLLVGVVALGVEVGSVPLLLVALPCAAACFTGVMMLLSVLGKTEAAVAGGSWVIVMPLAMLGGGMIPLIAMPKWMLTVSNISPFKWAILALEGAIWRDFTLAELALPIGILVTLAVVFYGLGVAIFRRHE